MTGRLWRTGVAGALTLVVAAGPLLGAAPAAAALARRHPVMGRQVLRPGQMVRWYRGTGARPARRVRIGRLARLFLQEGRDEGVRGDIAFAQSIVETNYFRSGGDVPPGPTTTPGWAPSAAAPAAPVSTRPVKGCEPRSSTCAPTPTPP
jgi:hypothetical protein